MQRIAPAGAPNGRPHRAVADMLARADTTDLSPAAFARLPAAAQGLGALDVLLAERDAPLAPGPSAEFRCAYAQAVAAHLALSAPDVLRADNGDARAHDARQLLASLIDGLKTVHADVSQMQRRPAFVAPPLTRAYYAARVAALEALYDAMNLEAMLPESKDWVKNRANTAWRTLKASDGAGGRGDGVAKGAEPPVSDVLQSLDVLSRLLADEIAGDIGVEINIHGQSRQSTR